MKFSAKRISQISLTKLFLLAALFSITAIDGNATATVDRTFGTDGRTTITFGEAQRIGDVAIQNNDKIIVAGDAWMSEATQRDGVLIRYNADGTPDQSFGNGGKVTLSLTPYNDSFYGVAVQTDGKIVAVGSVSPVAGSPNTDFLIVRFNENGTLDVDFGVRIINQGSSDSFRAVKIQPDGKIVAVGGTSDEGGRGTVIRLNQNGSLDTSFGGGIVFINLPAHTGELLTTVDFYADNRILIGGEAVPGGGSSLPRIGIVMLLEPNGTRVQNFGINGILQPELPSFVSYTRIKVLPDGKFIAGSFDLQIYTSEGSRISYFLPRQTTGIGLLSNGNIAILSRSSNERNGIGIYNKNLRLVGSDERYIGTSEFTGTALAIQSNDKIIILQDNVLLRLNGVTSDATRIANFDNDDFDRKTDPMVYRPSNRILYRSPSPFNNTQAYQFAVTPNQIIPERVSRQAFSSFIYWQAEPQSGSPGYFYANNASIQWGANGDAAVGGDYDGDGLTDYTVFRPSTGVWYIRQSSNNNARAVQFGQAGDRLVPADYDYDGITDIAVFRPANGTWYILRSSDNGVRAVQFGMHGDVPAAGDYDGDGRADFVVFRPSNGVWYMLKSQEGFSAIQFGIATDQPVPGDYDGDGRHDAAVFRDGFWHINQSRDGLKTVQWGLPGDIPISVRY